MHSGRLPLGALLLALLLNVLLPVAPPPLTYHPLRALLALRTTPVDKAGLSPQRAARCGAPSLCADAGARVTVAVLDSGADRTHPALSIAVVGYGDFVGDRDGDPRSPTGGDSLGHGTFVASVVAGRPGASGCGGGVAPLASLLTLRVFDDEQASRTTSMLAAFDAARAGGASVLLLSVGGPDSLDAPFTDAVIDTVARGVVVVSAVGNDGPAWGTVASPADLPWVVGVGGLGSARGRPGLSVAAFSSRGPVGGSMGEVDASGNVFPTAAVDVVAPAEDIAGAALGSGCRVMSGTSAAAPLVAGAVAVLLSDAASRLAGTHPGLLRSAESPAGVRQALHAGAIRLTGPSLFEQGAGVLSVEGSLVAAAAHPPLGTVTSFPSALPFSYGDCTYGAPLCDQPLWWGSGAVPVGLNLTLLNSVGVAGAVVGVAGSDAAHGSPLDPLAFGFTPETAAVLAPSWAPDNSHGALLDISLTTQRRLWPWGGWLAVGLVVGRDPASGRKGGGGSSWDQHTNVGTGEVVFWVLTELEADVAAALPKGGNGLPSLPVCAGDPAPRCLSPDGRALLVRVKVPVSAQIAMYPPPKDLRVLWDGAHSVSYPAAHVPADNAHAAAPGSSPFDIGGDGPIGNHRGFLAQLREQEFAVVVRRGGWASSCAPALTEYGVLLVVDPEKSWEAGEVAAAVTAVRSGTALLVFGDWWEARALKDTVYHDASSQTHWRPVTGGANLPGLNKLLAPFGFGLGGTIYSGEIEGEGGRAPYSSGSSLAVVPSDANVLYARLRPHTQGGMGDVVPVPVLALSRGESRVAVFGDSGCVDDSTSATPAPSRHCWWITTWLLGYVRNGGFAAAQNNFVVGDASLQGDGEVLRALAKESKLGEVAVKEFAPPASDKDLPAREAPPPPPADASLSPSEAVAAALAGGGVKGNNLFDGSLEGLLPARTVPHDAWLARGGGARDAAAHLAAPAEGACAAAPPVLRVLGNK